MIDLEFNSLSYGDKILVKGTTALAFLINAIGFALAMMYGLEDFGITYFVMWGLSIVWIGIFIYTNGFRKSKKNK